MDRKPDLNLLVTFEALLAERNVSRAAARLGLSQPAVSAQLSRLRDMFNDRLFLPAHRGVVPTPRALELQEPLRAALDEVRGIVRGGRRFDPSSAALTVKIAASDYVQCVLLAPFAAALRRQAPAVRIAALPLDGRVVGRQAELGDIDLAVMTPTTAPAALRHRHLFDEGYVCIVRRSHPLVRRGLNLKTFLALDHVVVSPRGGGFWGPAEAALTALGRRRRVVLSVSSFLVVPEIVAHSDLVALLPGRLVRGSRHPLQVLKPPIAVEGFSESMIWHERTHQHAGHRWVRDALAEWVSGRQSGSPRAQAALHRQPSVTRGEG